MKLESPQKYNQYASMFRGINDRINQLIFELTFNQEESVWKLDPSAMPENEDDNFEYRTAAIMASEGWSHEYYNHKEKIRVTQIDYMGSILNITHSFEQVQWAKTGRSKKIGDYLTYEAKATYYPKDRLDKKVSQVLHAWFTPELPYPYGPRGADGLPGLILELELNVNGKIDRKIIATKINVEQNSSKKCQVTLPKAIGEVASKDFLTDVSIEVSSLKKNK